MEKFLNWKLSKLDWLFFAAILGLALLGFSTIQSTITAGGENSDLIKIQIIAFIFGLVIFLAVQSIDYHYFLYFSPLFYFFSVILLILLFVFGQNIRGSVRWFSLGFFQLQPAEMAKPFLIIALASFFDFFKEKINSWRILFLVLALMIIPLFLIFREPDLGTFLILAFGLGAIFLSLPIKLNRLLTLAFLAAVFIPVFYFSLHSYQKGRLLTFLNPSADPLGSGYNVIQSVIAAGSGEIFGRGWGRGTQSHLRFLPEQHTDFIFATFAEENGFLGSMILLLLYVVLFIRSFKVLKETQDFLGTVLVLGSMVVFFSQAAINIGMNLGMLPVTGIPLPLVSYGGSQMVTSLLLLGIIAGVAKGQRTSYNTET